VGHEGHEGIPTMLAWPKPFRIFVPFVARAFVLFVIFVARPFVVFVATPSVA
jgi:hypothetical protein